MRLRDDRWMPLGRDAQQPGREPRLTCTYLVGLPGFEPGTSASRRRIGETRWHG